MGAVDLHTHTVASDGSGTLAQTLEAAARRGLMAVAVTEHFLDPKRRCISPRQLQALARRPRPEAPLLLVGVEVEADVSVGAAIASRLDLIIRSVHRLPGAPEGLWDPQRWDVYKRRVLQALEMPHTSVLGHVEGFLPLPAEVASTTTFEERREIERAVAARFFDEAFQDAVAEAALRAGVAVELHTATRTPRATWVRRLAKAGVRLSIGSDAHSPDRVGDIDWAYGLLEELSIPRSLLFVPRRLGDTAGRLGAPGEGSLA